MIMGGLCTRGCRFCAVETGNPNGWLDPHEPKNTAEAIGAMNARYVVVTSVDRDDLPDSGAAHFAATIQAIREVSPTTLVEVLIGDLAGKRSSLDTLVQARPDMLAHNVETVHRLSRRVRDKRANFEQSLEVLRLAKELDPGLPTKSSIMLGLGETVEEVIETMDELRAVGVDALTLGQYLQPTEKHLKVEEYVTPETFQHYEHIGHLKGFRYVASGPLVRSSYKAGSFHRLAQLGRHNTISRVANRTARSSTPNPGDLHG
jgi:lipoic acid synthetase